MSYVTCRVSRVTFFFFFFFLTKWWSLSVEGLLSTGPTPSSFLNVQFSLPITGKTHLSHLAMAPRLTGAVSSFCIWAGFLDLRSGRSRSRISPHTSRMSCSVLSWTDVCAGWHCSLDVHAKSVTVVLVSMVFCQESKRSLNVLCRESRISPGTLTKLPWYLNKWPVTSLHYLSDFMFTVTLQVSITVRLQDTYVQGDFFDWSYLKS